MRPSLAYILLTLAMASYSCYSRPPSVRLEAARLPEIKNREPDGSSYTRHLNIDGHDRYYIVYLPKQLNIAGPVPLILAFHPATSRPERFARSSRLHELGGERGFVVIYPAGYKGFWNSGRFCCGPPNQQGIDDVKFARSILDDVALQFHPDLNRIFATGFSNGGQMSYRLACELSDRIAAVAVTAAYTGAECHPQRPVAVLHFHGTADGLVPYSEATIGGIRMPGVSQTIRGWVERNRCPEKAHVSYQKGAATCVTYTRCGDGSEVSFCTIQGMGHRWPGASVDETQQGLTNKGAAQPFLPLGPGTDDLDATEMIISFFQNHRLVSGRDTNRLRARR